MTRWQNIWAWLGVFAPAWVLFFFSGFIASNAMISIEQGFIRFAVVQLALSFGAYLLGKHVTRD